MDYTDFYPKRTEFSYLWGSTQWQRWLCAHVNRFLWKWGVQLTNLDKD